MDDLTGGIITVVVAILSSSGLWALIGSVQARKGSKARLLLSLTYNAIMDLGDFYINRGYIEHHEFHEIHHHLYSRYKKLGGNGAIDRLMAILENLPDSPQEGE